MPRALQTRPGPQEAWVLESELTPLLAMACPSFVTLGRALNSLRFSHSPHLLNGIGVLCPQRVVCAHLYIHFANCKARNKSEVLFLPAKLGGSEGIESKLILGLSSSGLEKDCPPWWTPPGQLPSLDLAPRIKGPSYRCEC